MTDDPLGTLARNTFDRMVRDHAEALVVLDDIRSLHVILVEGGTEYCNECMTLWPCRTHRALAHLDSGTQ